MIGWLIAAGIVGAAVGSSVNKKGSSDSTTIIRYVAPPSNINYGPRIPYNHKRCNSCGMANTSVVINSNNRSFVVLKFKCLNCGRIWTKSYRIDA